MNRLRFGNAQYPDPKLLHGVFGCDQPWAGDSTYPTSERTLRETFFLSVVQTVASHNSFLGRSHSYVERSGDCSSSKRRSFPGPRVAWNERVIQ